MPTVRRQTAGFTLVEVFIVVTIMGILATLLIPSFEPNLTTQLHATADVVAADLALVRSLAVGNGSTYEITFAAASNEYYYEHTGANAALNMLPEAPFADYDDAIDRRTIRLDELPGLSQPPRLANVYKTFSSGLPQAVTTLEFGPLGQTTRSEPTVIYLTAGKGSARRLLNITIDPITGLASIGKVTNVLPAGVVVIPPGAGAGS